MALAAEVAGGLVGVYMTDEPARRGAEVGRVYAGTLAGPPAGPDLGRVAPR